MPFRPLKCSDLRMYFSASLICIVSGVFFPYMNQIAITPPNLSLFLFAGFRLSSSQFTIVISLTPSRIAMSFCLSPRSSLNLRIFWPKVPSGCLEIRKVTLKICLWILVLRLPLRVLHRSPQGMPLHSPSDTEIHK